MRYLWVLVLVLLPLYANADSTVVPGQQGDHWDMDGNGYPDVGVDVTGHYLSYYYYDDTGAYYWDLGDGRIYMSAGITDPGDLDQDTLTTCVYEVNYRGSFDNDPFLNSGWIMNQINCTGYDPGHFSYLIVNESDPRYTGNPDWAVWGNWEYHVDAEFKSGNLVRPEHYTP